MQLKRIQRHGLIIGSVAVGISALIFIFFGLQGSKAQIPGDFTAARERASAISADIVRLIREVNENVGTADLSETEGKKNQALAFLGEARKKNNEAYQKAFALSRELQKMAEAMGDISSRRAQQIAYEAIAIELSLVSEFIVYTENINKFLDALGAAIQSGLFADRNLALRYLKEVNEKSAAINNLNKQFIKKIEEFNRSL